MNMATKSPWNPTDHHKARNRSLADRLAHAKAMHALAAMPSRVVNRLADIIVQPQSPSQTLDDRMPTMDAAMDDIHGEGMAECDSNGEA